MRFRNVLLVTYHFPPSAASGTFRLLGFANHLPQFDWRVSVVAPPELPWEPTDRALVDQIPLATAVHSVPYPRRALKILRWAAPWGVWLRPAWRACKSIMTTEPIDAVLTSGPPHCVHVLGYHLRRKFGAPWIADFRDPWLSGSGGRAPRGVGALWARHWERKVFREADAILANAPNATSALRQAFPRYADKIATLTNGFDPFPIVPSGVSFASPIRLVHAGELYAGRDPRPLLDSVAALNRRSDARPIHLDIVGRTSQSGIDLDLEIKARRLGGVVKLHGQVAYGAARQAMIDADILVLLDGPGRTIGVPAKLYEYLGARRPILALAEETSDTANILQQSGMPHRVVSPAKPEKVTDALAELVSNLPSTRLGKCPLHFTREHLAGRLADILNDCVEASKRDRQALPA